MTNLYIEAFSGLSGDMFLGALAGLTDAYDELISLPEKLRLHDAKVEISEVEKNGIHCKHVHVVELKHKHHHEHNHEHGHHHHHHGRHLGDINKIIDHAHLDEETKRIAKEIFLIVGKAESKIHNIPLEKIHFHELSGVDSIIDIVGSAMLLSKIGVRKTYSTAVCTGFGFVKTQHGRLPVPAPATAEILSGIPQYKGDEEGERITPTGAAIIKYLNPEFSIPVLTQEKTAYGPGTKKFIAPNVLRISFVKEEEKPGKMMMLETNIDDMTGELLGADFQQGVLDNGAADFYLSSVQMKKGRPGWLFSCLVKNENLDELSDYILENTSTIGIRYYEVERKTLDREIRKVQTKYGPVRIKIVITPSGNQRTTFEYNDLLTISKREDIPVIKLQHELLSFLNQ